MKDGGLHRLLKPWPIWKGLWKKRESMHGWYLPLWMIAMVILLLAIPYALINHFVDQLGISRMDPAISLDDAIPFIAWSIIPYASLYLYYPAGAILAPKDDLGRRQMLILHQILFIVAWLVYVLFLILPTKIHIREQIPADIREGEGFWGFLYGDVLHNTDMPWNAWPSLHIIQSLLIVLVASRWLKTGSSGKGVLLEVMWVGWLLLAISVLTTKQHFVFDLFSGLLVAMVCWLWLLRPALLWAESEEAVQHCKAWE